MPYRSKADRYLDDYVTLADAISRVQENDQCDKRSALRQILAALVDNEIAARWTDQKSFERPPGSGEDRIEEHGRALFWREDRILLENDGMALHDGVRTPEDVRREALRAGVIGYRMFVLKKDDILKIWPGPQNALPPQVNAIVRETPTKEPRKPGRSSVRNLVHATLSQMLNDNKLHSRKHASIAQEVAKANNKRLDEDPGWAERTVVRHVSAWLNENGISPPRE